MNLQENINRIKEVMGLVNEEERQSTSVKPGIEELFDFKPEFANLVYETLGFDLNNVTPEQKQQALQVYSQYLDTIFPDSKVKDILYHASGHPNITKFLPGKLDIGIHFGTKSSAEHRATKRENAVIYPVILNIDSILETNDLSIWTPEFVFKELEGLGLVDASEFNNITDLYDKESNNALRKNAQDAVYDWLQEKTNANAIKYVNAFEDKGSTSYIVYQPEQIHILGNKQDIEGFKNFINN